MLDGQSNPIEHIIIDYLTIPLSYAKLNIFCKLLNLLTMRNAARKEGISVKYSINSKDNQAPSEQTLENKNTIQSVPVPQVFEKMNVSIYSIEYGRTHK